MAVGEWNERKLTWMEFELSIRVHQWSLGNGWKLGLTHKVNCVGCVANKLPFRFSDKDVSARKCFVFSCCRTSCHLADRMWHTPIQIFTFRRPNWLPLTLVHIEISALCLVTNWWSWKNLGWPTEDEENKMCTKALLGDNNVSQASGEKLYSGKIKSFH